MRYETAHIDELERLDSFGVEGVWRPVRQRFGIEGFGVNAFTATEAGSPVIEDHDELASAGDEGRHQELYVVLSGRATFTLDGEERDAPAGTFVFVGEPDVRRSAIAAEPNTSVLAIGARPGEPFRVSAWEYYFRAAAVGGAEGQAIFDEAADRFPNNPRVAYNRACLLAREGERVAALEALAQAIEFDPVAREWAAADEDFASLRDDDAFKDLIGGG